MEPVEISRTLVTHVDNSASGLPNILLNAKLTWAAKDPAVISVKFLSETEGVEDVRWFVGVDFIQEAMSYGHAGDQNLSAYLAQVVEEDFVLMLRGINSDGAPALSSVTWSVEKLEELLEKIQLLAQELDYSIELDTMPEWMISND